MRANSSRPRARVDALRQRLDDTATYLRGIAAVVESMNKSAADNIEIAINAVLAVSDDLETACDDIAAENSRIPQYDAISNAGAPVRARSEVQAGGSDVQG